MPGLTLPDSDSEPDYSNLWIAAGEGNLSLVQHYLSHGGPNDSSLDPNAKDEFQYTCLHAAVSYSHIHVVEYLLDQGADVNISDGDGDTPLHVVENVDIARLLIDKGADPTLVNDSGMMVRILLKSHV